MADKECSSCHEPLLLEIEPDSDNEDSKAPAQVESIPDDVELSCGCHFHWYGLQQ
jgi:ferredoxin